MCIYLDFRELIEKCKSRKMQMNIYLYTIKMHSETGVMETGNTSVE